MRILAILSKCRAAPPARAIDKSPRGIYIVFESYISFYLPRLRGIDKLTHFY
jgi:hypothetical protein